MSRVDRRQVLAYRVQAQGLHRDTGTARDLAVLDLGVQDTPPGSAVQAMAVRLGSPPPPSVAAGLATTWSVRGAPHVHRDDELLGLSRALWPGSDEDALARLDTSASPVRGAGMPAREALRLVAEQIADIVDEPMPKGEVSTALTPRIPAAMTVDCRQCKAAHIVETLFRSAVLPAGMTFDPGQRTVVFVPVPGWPGIPGETVGADRLIRGYLRLLGPATPDEVAGFLGTKPSELPAPWPQDLAEVEVEGTPAWIPEDAVAALSAPPDPPAVRLLPPSDPFLQARDRELLVPAREHQKALWPILGRPGALLVDGEVAGIWRARKKGRRLDVTVQPFGRLAASARRGVEEEATLLAEARGVTAADVTVE
ncbi:MAG TPA: winged helix DNA-binding domain-containing protein [Egibacteraceae bacterium]|nr:winged helix DNA-binding domain-containing protein [Egibacteraceae bacterium]